MSIPKRSVTRLADVFLVAAAIAAAPTGATEPAGLHQSLDRLTREGKFSGAVVVRGPEGVRFARGYGLADPFAGRPFTPQTSVDSASLAKPVTAAAVLQLDLYLAGFADGGLQWLNLYEDLQGRSQGGQ